MKKRNNKHIGVEDFEKVPKKIAQDRRERKAKKRKYKHHMGWTSKKIIERIEELKERMNDIPDCKIKDRAEYQYAIDALLEAEGLIGAAETHFEDAIDV